MDFEYILKEDLTDVIDIKSSASQTFALKKDGTIWAVDYQSLNFNKQLENLTGIKAFACGSDNIVAIKNDGSVIEYDVSEKTEKQFPNLYGAVSVDGAYFTNEESPHYLGSYFCALLQDGSVWVWGDNEGLISTVDFDKPSKVKASMAMYTINNPTMIFDGVAQEIYSGSGLSPFLMNDRTYIPVRNLTEKFGGTVAWNEALKEVTVTNNSREIKLYINKNTVIVDGKEQQTDAPPIIVGDRTFLPLRTVMELMGFDVEWDESSYSVFINQNNPAE